MTKEELAVLIAAKESEIEETVIRVKHLYETRSPELTEAKYRDYIRIAIVESETLDDSGALDETIDMLVEFKAQAQADSTRPGYHLNIKKAYSYEDNEDVAGNYFQYEYIAPSFSVQSARIVRRYILSLLNSSKYELDCNAVKLFQNGSIDWNTLVSLHSPCKV